MPVLRYSELRRRDFLRGAGMGAGLAGALTLSAAIASCGSGPFPVDAMTGGDAKRLNLALNLTYVSTQYHALAAGGAGVPPAMATGIGRQGSAIGARAVPFVDPLVAGLAAELAADKLERVAALRKYLGASAAAMPVLDLSASPNGAFGVAVRATRRRGAQPFDPYVDDATYLVGAFILEDGVATTLRSITEGMFARSSVDVLADEIARATFHGGLVEAIADWKAVDDPGLADMLAHAGVAARGGARSLSNTL